MARVTAKFNDLELARLIEGLEASSHLDEDPIDQDMVAGLIQRLDNLLDQLDNQRRKQLYQPADDQDISEAVQEIADLLFS